MRRSRWLFLFLILFLIAGCANQAALSPKAKATMMLATYNSQAEATKIMSERTNLTETQKEAVRKKKEIFIKLQPLITAYAITVKQGGVPSLEDEAAIYSMIDDLVAITP